MTRPFICSIRRAPLLAATLLLAPATATSQAAVARAQAALQAGKADSAIRELEAFYRANPTATVGRLLLGNAWRQKGDTAKALAAYAAVTTPLPARIAARFNASSLILAQGRVDEAFDTLRVLKRSGAFDMDVLRTAPAFERIRRDPRFESLMFHPEDFTNPFVEPVRIIHEWIGETKGDQYSWIARGIGDADGDGVTDVVTSAPTFGSNGQPAGPGKVYVYSGRSGKLLWSKVGTGSEGLGTGLEGAGDVNGDGAGDVIAGAPGSSHAYVYSGKDGRVLFTLAGRDSGEAFGQAVSGAGDQDGDGHEDLIVGAPGNSAHGQGSGRAYVFSGRDGAVLITLDGDTAGAAFGSIVAGRKGGVRTPVVVGAPGAGPRRTGRVYTFPALSPRASFAIDAEPTGQSLGAMFTSLVGDVDGDRVPDVYASDFSDTAKGPATGRIYVHSGADGRRLLQIAGEHSGDGFGIGSADVGDVNGDGHDDLIVGAWQHAGAAPSGGKVYLYSGRDGTLLRSITGRVPGETFGFDATGVGDVDGDGAIDFLLTSSWSNINGFRSGRMFVISGR